MVQHARRRRALSLIPALFNRPQTLHLCRGIASVEGPIIIATLDPSAYSKALSAALGDTSDFAVDPDQTVDFTMSELQLLVADLQRALHLYCDVVDHPCVRMAGSVVSLCTNGQVDLKPDPELHAQLCEMTSMDRIEFMVDGVCEKVVEGASSALKKLADSSFLIGVTIDSLIKLVQSSCPLELGGRVKGLLTGMGLNPEDEVNRRRLLGFWSDFGRAVMDVGKAFVAVVEGTGELVKQAVAAGADFAAAVVTEVVTEIAGEEAGKAAGRATRTFVRFAASPLTAPISAVTSTIDMVNNGIKCAGEAVAAG